MKKYVLMPVVVFGILAFVLDISALDYALKHTLKGHTDGIYKVLFSPDGSIIATAGLDHTMRLWDVKKGTLEHTLTTDTANSITFSPDGSTIASDDASETIVRLWDVRTGTLKHNLTTGPMFYIYKVLFSPDSNTIATGGFDRTVSLWNAKTGTLKHTLIGHTLDIADIALSPGGSTIATGSWDSTVRLWDTKTGTSIHTLKGHSGDVCSVSFSPDGSTIATGDYNGIMHVWNAKTGTLIHTFKAYTDSVEHVGGVQLRIKFSISFSPDGSTIITGGHNRRVHLWNARTGTLIHALKGHLGIVSSLDPPVRMVAPL